jgi:hypothetical protein
MIWEMIPSGNRKSPGRGDSMGKKPVLAMMCISLLLVLVTFGNAWAELKVGDAAPRFTLATTQDKPVSYSNEYYGKYHLVLQFFANAFGGG